MSTSLTQLSANLLNRPLYLLQSFVPDLERIDFAVPVRIIPVRIRLIYTNAGHERCLLEHEDKTRYDHYWADIRANRNLFATFDDAQTRFMQEFNRAGAVMQLGEYQQIVRDFERSQRDLQVLKGILDQDTPLL